MSLAHVPDGDPEAQESGIRQSGSSAGRVPGQDASDRSMGAGTSTTALPSQAQSQGSNPFGSAVVSRRTVLPQLPAVFSNPLAVLTGRSKSSPRLADTGSDADLSPGRMDMFGTRNLANHRGFEPMSYEAWGSGSQNPGATLRGRTSQGSQGSAGSSPQTGPAPPGSVPQLLITPSAPPDGGCSPSSPRSWGSVGRSSLTNLPWNREEKKPKLRRDGSLEQQKPVGKRALQTWAFLQLWTVQGFMLALTFVILYIQDLFTSVAELEYDAIFIVILWVCLVFFVADWFLNIFSSAAQTPAYTGSLFFYLDFIAAASIVVDIVMSQASNLQDSGTLARAARSARIGTRAGRSVRLVRLMRFIRLVRITRVIKAMLAHRSSSRARRRQELLDEHIGSNVNRADTIGAQIGATTTRKVVIMTLLLLCILPFLTPDIMSVCNAELRVTLESIWRAAPADVQQNCTKFQDEVSPIFSHGSDISPLVTFSQNEAEGMTRGGVLYVKVKGCVLFRDQGLLPSSDGDTFDTLISVRRAPEIHTIPCDGVFLGEERSQGDLPETFLIYDNREENIELANYSMALTTVIIVILLGFSMIFSADAEGIANELVVPIRQLMEDMDHTAQLRLEKVTSLDDMFASSVYEVQKLQEAYQNLNGAVGSFSKFTPLEVVRHFLSLGTEAKLGVDQRNVSIFFSDIAGFTTICEKTTPVEVLSLLSEYFESMVSIIVEEQGTMLEFIGDAILAIWNAPTNVPDHGVRAITSALRMNTVLTDLRRRWMDEGKPDIRIRCGLHSADVFVGNLGSKMRMKYGVLGDGVNLASRLEELNKRYSTDVLVSEDLLKQEGVKEHFAMRPVDLVVVKGRTKPTAIFEVLASKETASEACMRISELSHSAMEAYRGRDFNTAIALLEQIRTVKGVEVDKVGQVLAQRCRAYAENPPPSDWDGSEVLTAKTF